MALGRAFDVPSRRRLSYFFRRSHFMTLRTFRPEVDQPAPDHVAGDLQSIRDRIIAESDAVAAASRCIDASALAAANRFARCRGAVVVTGVGKAGLIGQKLVATLASTGTPAHFLHPTEAIHGDLGRVTSSDWVWALSNSGRTEELNRILPFLKTQSRGIVSMTAKPDNPTAQLADIAITIGSHDEIDAGGLAPTASTAAMIAVGDAVAITASELRNFSARDFARFHPGGSLGRKLSNAVDHMRRLEDCRVVRRGTAIASALETARGGRHVGAVLVVDDDASLLGIFTDSDLVRVLTDGRLNVDAAIETVMTREPIQVTRDADYVDVVETMDRHRISELPVVDDAGRLVGLIDRVDLSLEDAPRSVAGQVTDHVASAATWVEDRRSA